MTLISRFKLFELIRNRVVPCLAHFATVVRAYWLLVVSFCMASFNEWPIGKPRIDLPEYKYHVVVYGVFLSWLHMMILWGRATKVGLYVKLLKKVAKTFIYSISAYSPPFLGFAISFYILFPNMQFTENIGFAVLKVGKVIISK